MVEVVSYLKANDFKIFLVSGAEREVRGDFVIKNININKANLIAREIGKQPVLAFGNSSAEKMKKPPKKIIG